MLALYEGQRSPVFSALRKHKKIGLQFLLIELDLAITYCRIGLTTNDLFSAKRNAGNAREALKSVLRTKERLSLTDLERQMIWDQTSEFVVMIVQLERRLALSRMSQGST